MMIRIPFNKQYYTGQEIGYIREALLEEGRGDSYFTNLCAAFFEKEYQIPQVFMTTSGTHALEMAVLLLGLEPGQEVIMPSFTFPSTANSVLLRGVVPVFAEIAETTLNLDPEDIKRKITHRTRAIMPVHYGGTACAMDEIISIARAHGLYLVEDAAQGINAKYRDRYLGTWGDLGCISFHSTKNIACGEGGALFINSKEPQILKRAEIIWNKGTNRTQFLRGEIERYSWVGTGSNYTPGELGMAVLWAQLKQADLITAKRKGIYEYYREGLASYKGKGLIGLPVIPEGVQSNYHIFYMIFSSERIRKRVQDELNKRGIQAVIHFVPLHSSAMGKKLGYVPEDLPVTERVGKSLLRLPLYNSMTDQEKEYVLENVQDVLERID